MSLKEMSSQLHSHQPSSMSSPQLSWWANNMSMMVPCSDCTVKGLSPEKCKNCNGMGKGHVVMVDKRDRRHDVIGSWKGKYCYNCWDTVHYLRSIREIENTIRLGIHGTTILTKPQKVREAIQRYREILKKLNSEQHTPGSQRRLAHGDRTPVTLTALMQEIKDAKRSWTPRRR